MWRRVVRQRRVGIGPKRFERGKLALPPLTADALERMNTNAIAAAKRAGNLSPGVLLVHSGVAQLAFRRRSAPS